MLDDRRSVAHLYGADGTTREFGVEDELTIPEILGGFRVKVSRLFE